MRRKKPKKKIWARESYINALFWTRFNKRNNKANQLNQNKIMTMHELILYSIKCGLYCFGFLYFVCSLTPCFLVFYCSKYRLESTLLFYALYLSISWSWKKSHRTESNNLLISSYFKNFLLLTTLCLFKKKICYWCYFKSLFQT